MTYGTVQPPRCGELKPTVEGRTTFICTRAPHPDQPTNHYFEPVADELAERRRNRR